MVKGPVYIVSKEAAEGKKIFKFQGNFIGKISLSVNINEILPW